MSGKTHWKQFMNPNYIGAYALPEGQDLTVTMDFVQLEEVVGEKAKKDNCSVLHLIGQKPMILNATNSKSIAKLYGPYVEDWQGKQITLFATTTKMAGEMVECLRIRPKVAVKVAKPIAAERFAKAIEAIKAKTYTPEQLRAGFALTEDQENELMEALENAEA